jgi:hypothetical protein
MTGRCGQAITRRLAEHGGWMGRAELAAGLPFGAGVVDDELTDLVVAGTVLFNTRAQEYRLGGTLYARRAVRMLVRGGHRRAAVAGQAADKTRAAVGLAMQVPQADGSQQLVMAELDLPYEGLDGMLRLSTALDKWLQA